MRVLWAGTGAFDRFKVVFSAALVAVMILFGFVVNTIIVRTATMHAAEEGTIFLAGFLQPFIAPEANGAVFMPAARTALRRILPDAYISEEHVRVHFVLIRVWSPDGDLLFSSDDSRLPRPTAAIERALTDAFIQVEAEIDVAGAVASQHTSGEFIGMVAPLHRVGSEEVVALLEAYQDRGFIVGELHQVRRSMWTVIGIVSVILVGCLFLFAVRASRTIEAQRKDLVDGLDAAQRLAVENAALTARAEASRSQIAHSNDRYLERIGSDLHDGPLQTLSALLMALRALGPRIAQKREEPAHSGSDPVALALAVYDELREIASGLVLPDIKQGSLENAVLQAALRHEQKTGSSVDLATRGLPDEASPVLKINCYRIVQEALANAYKHAGGAGQKVRAIATESELRLIIADIGPGMPDRPKGGGLGLVGIRNRAAALKGRLTVRSEAGHGTQVSVTIPLAPRAGYDDDSDPDPESDPLRSELRAASMATSTRFRALSLSMRVDM